MFDFVDTESVSDWRVNVHCFKSDRSLFILVLKRKCSHIVNTVSKLNDNNSYIL